jgi:hypothetical protein
MGLLTKSNLRTDAWRRLFRGIYADSSIPDSHQLRCAAASRYLLAPNAAIAGRSAVALHTVAFSSTAPALGLDVHSRAGAAVPQTTGRMGAGPVSVVQPTEPVEVLVPSGKKLGPVTGLAVHSGDLHPDEIMLIRRIRVTVPVRTCWDLVRWLELPDAVALVDMLIAARLVTIAELERYGIGRVDKRGARQFTQAVSLVNGAAESPQESRLRVRLVLAGFPPPEAQFAVFDDGRFLARVDLAWPELKIAIEYDGLWHVGSARQMHADRERLNRLVGAGWIVLHVTSARLRDDFTSLVTEIRTAIHTRASQR